MDFWYLLISRRATVPGLYLWGFFTPPVAGADFLAALVASCFLGAFPPVDLRAVCLVRAIATVRMILMAPAVWPPLILTWSNSPRGRHSWPRYQILALTSLVVPDSPAPLPPTPLAGTLDISREVLSVGIIH